MASSQEFSKVVSFNQNAGGWHIEILGKSYSKVTFNEDGNFSGTWRVYSDCWFTAIDENGNIILDDFGQPLNRWYFYDNGGSGTFSGSGNEYTFSGMVSDGRSTIDGSGVFSENRTIATETINLGIYGIGTIQGFGTGHYDMDIIGGDTDDELEGNSGFDYIDGADGNDNLKGEVGNDVLIGGAGNDELRGGSGDDNSFGGLGNDIIYVNVLEGKDTVDGGNGDDMVHINGKFSDYSVYIFKPKMNAVASNASTKQVMLTDKSGNTFTFSSVENIQFEDSEETIAVNSNGLLKGAGTDGKDVIKGDDADNLINAGNGNDKVTGNGGDDQINGGAGLDNLVDGAGNDRLDGGAGIDSLSGGVGNDTYYLDSAKDKIIEKLDEGDDTAIVSASYVLAKNVERLVLSGSNKINGTGNASDNVITGSNEDNSINGGLGNDVLTGGFGKDNFVFNTKLGPTNIDTITDFTSGEDKIALSSSIFTKLKGDKDLADNFVISAAVDSNDYLIYDTETGQLFYDADGSGNKAEAIQIALIGVDNHAALSANDFVMIK